MYRSLTDRRKRVNKEMIEDLRPRVRRYFKWAFFAAIAGPISIVLHEIGHMSTALFLGYSNLFITYHSWGGKAPMGITSVERAWINAGGPIASFLIVMACICALCYRRELIFPKVLGFLAPVQFMGCLLFVTSSLLGLSGSKVYDAARAADNLGIPVFLASLPGTIVLVASWAFFIHSIEKNHRVKEILSIVIGGILGFILWLTVIGPIILP